MTEIEKFINEFDDELIWLTLEKGKLIFPNKNTRTADFNRACDHVERLLNDSYILYSYESYGSSVFLAITAIEEVAKIHFGLYRNNEEAENVPRHQDSLFNHREKHKLGLLPTVLMGSRLLRAVDETLLLQVLDKTKRGKLVALRESSIYAENGNSKFKIPEDVISKDLCRCLLLLACEVFDDQLVGYTSHSSEVGRRVDEIFLSVAG
jgi:AbiV family abortive infection protein